MKKTPAVLLANLTLLAGSWSFAAVTKARVTVNSAKTPTVVPVSHAPALALPALTTKLAAPPQPGAELILNSPAFTKFSPAAPMEAAELPGALDSLYIGKEHKRAESGSAAVFAAGAPAGSAAPAFSWSRPIVSLRRENASGKQRTSLGKTLIADWFKTEDRWDQPVKPPTFRPDIGSIATHAAGRLGLVRKSLSKIVIPYKDGRDPATYTEYTDVTVLRPAKGRGAVVVVDYAWPLYARKRLKGTRFDRWTTGQAVYFVPDVSALRGLKAGTRELSERKAAAELQPFLKSLERASAGSVHSYVTGAGDMGRTFRWTAEASGLKAWSEADLADYRQVKPAEYLEQVGDAVRAVVDRVEYAIDLIPGSKPRQEPEPRSWREVVTQKDVEGGK